VPTNDSRTKRFIDEFEHIQSCLEGEWGAPSIELGEMIELLRTGEIVLLDEKETDDGNGSRAMSEDHPKQER
jgi:hypothetical protein